jgi:hypothetical protein
MSSIRAASVAALSLFTALACAPNAFAHCYVGARFFPAMLATDDPCVADELSLPTISAFSTGDDVPSNVVTISGEFSKRITPTLGVSVGSTWTQITPPGQPSVAGFQNLDTSLKWQFGTIPEREFVMSAGIAVEWGGTGSQAVGAETFNTYVPTVWFGKGFGDLPDSVKWLRPFAVTGQVGYAIPGISTVVTIDPDTGDANTQTNPQVLRWGGSLQYSMPYLKSNVVDLGISDFFNRMIFIVEASMQTPIANAQDSGILTTGTINPGIIWIGRYYQFGVEAVVPVNRVSGADVGIIAQVHIYLDDIFPGSIGKPLFGGSGMARRMGY